MLSEDCCVLAPGTWKTALLGSKLRKEEGAECLPPEGNGDWRSALGVFAVSLTTIERHSDIRINMRLKTIHCVFKPEVPQNKRSRKA